MENENNNRRIDHRFARDHHSSDCCHVEQWRQQVIFSTAEARLDTNRSRVGPACLFVWSSVLRSYAPIRELIGAQGDGRLHDKDVMNSKVIPVAPDEVERV